MNESVTYQAIVEEGVLKGQLKQARHILLRQVEHLFGKPAGASVQSRIESINSLDVLDHLTDRVLPVHSWEELLADVAAPEPRRGRGKRRP